MKSRVYAMLVLVLTMQKFTIRKSELETFAERFISSIKPHKEKAVLIGLKGNLGAGKTTFVQKCAHALGIIGHITSPTFVILKKYPIQKSDFPFDTLMHIDAYRLEGGKELIPLGIQEELENPKNLILLEWPERVEDVLPKKYQTVSFEVAGDDIRDITIYNVDAKEIKE